MSRESLLVSQPIYLTASSAMLAQLDGCRGQYTRMLVRASSKSRIRRLRLGGSTVCRVRSMRLLATPIRVDESSEAIAAPAPFPNHPGVPVDAV